MIKLLIGGSPCTFWSIAQKNNRETEASGIGWELFRNYLIAKDKFKPDFFLYENNKSAAQAIKDQIKHELGVYQTEEGQHEGQLDLFRADSGARYIEINSALVSAQNRQRFYVHNCGDVQQPEDRGILLRDILESGCAYRDKSTCLAANRGGHSFAHDLKGSRHTCVAIPVKIAEFGKGGQGNRVYSVDGKAVAQTAQSGGLGSNTGLYAIPLCETDDGKETEKVYEVKNGQITIKGKQYPIKLDDGFYIIRKLTVTECCRLQTMPDDYCRAVSNTQAYRGLGNGWTAEVIIHILNGALKDVPRDEEIVVLSMYDGIGTGRYCLDKMGFKNVKYYAYEIDKYAMQIAQSNYPDIIECGDAFAVRDDNWVLGATF